MIQQGEIDTRAPALVLVKGHPGSGKTSVARGLARRLLWPVVDKDDARGPLHTSDFGGVSQSRLNELSYQVMFRIVKTQLECGLSVIVDCPFARKELFNEAKELAEKSGARIVILECEARDEEIWKSRLEERATQDETSPESHKPQNWQALRALIESYRECWRWSDTVDNDVALRRVIDTTAQEDLETIIHHIIQDLKETGVLTG
ncbi:hypothetical protein BSKO_08275 [Bryopsis sp. KO-2023]|nr:hypothetical protein BSKO_08275 [Bryopsis sp. KO-2023]